MYQLCKGGGSGMARPM